MNLLDQLANFCPTPVSINLLENMHEEGRENRHGPRTARHHSVFAISKCDTRHSKSIDRLQTWVPSNKQQLRKKVLYKLLGTLSNKARKIFFTFWVNCEQAIKNKKSQQSKSEWKIAGSEKIIGFIQAYEAKQSQVVGLPLAFSKLSKYSKLQQVGNCLQRALSPPIRRLQSNSIKTISQNQNFYLKMDIIINTLQVIAAIQIKRKFITALKLNAHQNIQKCQHEVSQAQNSKQIIIHSNKLKSLPAMINQQNSYMKIETFEAIFKMLGKLPIDKAIQNCPEICDSNILFIQQPPTFIKTIKQTSLTTPTETSLQKLCLRARKNSCRLDLHSQSQFLDSSKKQITLMDTQPILKTQNSTPKCRSISSSSIFNVDETRLEKLQNKLFGTTIKNESRFSVNGQDWKSDRKELEQIIYHIKSPQKISRRNSAYDMELGNLHQKMEYYRGRAVKENMIPKMLNLEESKQLRDPKSSIMKCMMEKEKKQGRTDQKILISLKSKRKQSTPMHESSQKAEYWGSAWQGQARGRNQWEGGRK